MSGILGGNYLQADLDGTLAPIFVESSYTFTDGETARGFVSFRNGFDIPADGTVILELAPGMGVDGAVNFNGGTLELREHCIFGPRVVINGKGFIKSNGSTLFLENPINVLTDNPFTLLGNISIIGIGFPFLALRGAQGGLNLASDALLSCTFKNLDIQQGNNDLLFTSSISIRELVFDHCNIRFGTGVVTILKTPRVIMM